jgi:hypothetical protein
MAIIDENGFQIQTQAEISVSVDSEMATKRPDIKQNIVTPYTMMRDVIAQANRDLQENILYITNMLSLPTAEGKWLDSVHAPLKGVFRKNGSYTYQNVDVTTISSAELAGLDVEDGDVFTVYDNNGVYYQLVNSTTISSAGTYTLEFRSELMGSYTSEIGTITNASLIVGGVESVTNSEAPTSIGTAPEGDFALQNRIQLTSSLSTTNTIDVVYGKIMTIDGVSDCSVFENTLFQKNIDITTNNGVYVVCEGGSDEDIASVLSTTIPLTISTFGSESYVVTSQQGLKKTFYFDRANLIPIYAKFTIANLEGSISESLLKEYISSNISYLLSNDTASSTDVIVKAIEYVTANSIKCNVVDGLLSVDDVTYTSIITKTALKDKFYLPSSNITIISS